MREQTKQFFQSIGYYIGKGMLTMSHPLAGLIPTSNVISIPAMFGAGALTALQAAYNPDVSSFIGVFLTNNPDMPKWAKDIAEWDKREFHKDNPNKITLFGDVCPELAGANGENEAFPNWRYAIEQWIANGRIGVEPYTCNQDYGSCVDASASEHTTTMLGYRAAIPSLQEKYIDAAAWYWYGDRGFCSDGWTGSACASVALRRGIAFRKKYVIGSNEVDFTDDNKNENIVARQWCRNGIPSYMSDYTQTNHPFEEGSITEFNGGIVELRTLLANGGVLHTGGVKTSGGSKPFQVGRVGPHMQSVIGGDHSENYRKFAKDVIGVTLLENDFACVFHQIWGAGWSGQTAKEFWPDWWGPQPEGAWTWKASDVIRYFAGDMYAWLPRFKGIKDESPVPPAPIPPIPPGPQPSSKIYFLGDVKAFDSQTNEPLGDFVLTPKPQVN